MMGAELYTNIIRTCGSTNIVFYGVNGTAFLRFFLSRGIEAFAFCTETSVVERCGTRFPSRCFLRVSSRSFPPFSSLPRTALIVDFPETEPEDRLPELLQNLRDVTRRYLVLDLKRTEVDGVIRNREWWENLCIEAGFRRHPRMQEVCPYWDINEDKDSFVLYLEKIPDSVLEQFPLNKLLAERMLHMDMLRETGRRSDAHVVRYVMAARYIRPGDTVLDCACGMGYGSYILYHNSQAKKVIGVDLSETSITYAQGNYTIGEAVTFRLEDAQNLKSIADNSIDFVTGFETIEHLPEPDSYLYEISRVLRPSGRVMLSAPDMWIDETGKDPNPFHFHLYTWSKLRDQVRAHFILEKGFTQIAGGALKLPGGIREWNELPVDTPDTAISAEWVLALGMKNPLQKGNATFRETTFPIPDDPDFHVLAIEKEYDNPWLLKGMIAIGMRLDNPVELEKLQRNVLEHSEVSSADYGAALCGFLYGLMRNPGIETDEWETWANRVETYCAEPVCNMTQLRWKVSLLYVMAILAQLRGDFSSARKYFTRCAEVDVIPYSPLLGTKILDSLFALARFSLNENDLKSVKQLLQKTISEAKRYVAAPWLNIIGDIQHPIYTGCPELSQILDKASRATYILNELSFSKEESRNAKLSTESYGYFERLLLIKDSEISVYRNAYRSGEDHIQNLLNELNRNREIVNIYEQKFLFFETTNANFEEKNRQLTLELEKVKSLLDNTQYTATNLQIKNKELLQRADELQCIVNEIYHINKIKDKIFPMQSFRRKIAKKIWDKIKKMV